MSKATGGTGNSLNDEAALKFMGTFYNLFRQNIAYETTPGGYQPEGLLHQYLKYGRDVFAFALGNVRQSFDPVCQRLRSRGPAGLYRVGARARLCGRKAPAKRFAGLRRDDRLRRRDQEIEHDFCPGTRTCLQTYQKWYADGL